MTAIELHPRIIENKDWATVVFIIAISFIVVAKTSFEKRYNDFVRIIVSDKYTKIYRESSHLMSGFNVLLFTINVISLSFFIQLVLFYYGYAEKNDWIMYVRIFTLLNIFILSKFLVEKIIAVFFGVEELVEQFNLQKVNYRTYVGLLLLPVSIILFYTNNLTNSLILTLIFTLLTINTMIYMVFLKNYQNLLISKLFYFILYLCALEIAPYYFIYYLITKN